jgi:methylthioribose-1-phosphate isomerase
VNDGGSRAPGGSPRPIDSVAEADSGEPDDDSGSSDPSREDAASSVDRRSFFRAFSRQTVTTVAQVAGMANAVQRSTTAAMVGAVGYGLGNPAQNAARLSAPTANAVIGAPDTAIAADEPPFRSPYRLIDGTLHVLDQRQLPDRLEEIACVRAADVAFQMRMLAVNGGPLLGQLAAYGFALTGAEAAAWPASRRRAELRRASQLLTYARPAARPVRAALGRLEAIATEMDPGVEDFEMTGPALAEALMTEANAIASEAAIAHAAIAQHTAALLRPADGQPLRVLIVGDPGLLTSGQVGTGIPALQLLAQSGVDVQVRVAEGSPRLDGARLASWELRLAGIDHTIVADTAVAWLLATQPIDAVLMAAEWIAPDGDVIATIGGRAVAELAAARLYPDIETQVYILAPTSCIGPDTFAATSEPAEHRASRELISDRGSAGHRGASGLNPAVELIPSSRISAIVTEDGVHRAPFADLNPAGPT